MPTEAELRLLELMQRDVKRSREAVRKQQAMNPEPKSTHELVARRTRKRLRREALLVERIRNMRPRLDWELISKVINRPLPLIKRVAATHGID